jgi:hypothetical protein
MQTLSFRALYPVEVEVAIGRGAVGIARKRLWVLSHLTPKAKLTLQSGLGLGPGPGPAGESFHQVGHYAQLAFFFRRRQMENVQKTPRWILFWQQVLLAL